MENNREVPTPEEAAAALSEAAAARSALVGAISAPSGFFVLLGAAIAVHLAAVAAGLARGDTVLIACGVVIFLVVAVVLLVRFRRANGVALGAFTSRVVLGTGALASVSYAAGLALAIWAGYAGVTWLIVVASVLGGAGYAVGGLRWLRSYRRQPEVLGQERPAWEALLVVAVTGLGLVLLLLQH